MINNLKEVCSAVWQKKEASVIGDLLVKPESGSKEKMSEIVSEVLEQMDEMKNYDYDSAYLDQVRGVFVKKMRESNIDCGEIKPVLESIKNGRVKHILAIETAIYFRDKGDLDAVEVFMPRIDVTGGPRDLI